MSPFLVENSFILISCKTALKVFVLARMSTALIFRGSKVGMIFALISRGELIFRGVDIIQRRYDGRCCLGKLLSGQ